jgi:hypothetical protein
MPRPLGICLIVAASLLGGILAWFCLIWLVSMGARLTDASALQIAMFVLSPHMSGWLIVLGIGVVLFVAGIRFARKRGLAWLGFACNPAPSTDRNQHPPPPVDGDR